MMRYIALIGILVLGCCKAADVPQAFQQLSGNETVSNMMAATLFMSQLKTDNMIPGFSTNDHGKLMIIPSGNPEPKATYPITVMSRATLDKEPNHLYWFSVSRTNEQAEWRVVKSWKTDEQGTIIIPDRLLPSESDQKIAYRKVLESKDFQTAMKQFSASQRWGAVVTWTEYYHANDLADRGEYGEALRLAEDRIRTQPNDAYAHFILGRVFYQKGEWDKAIESLEKAENLAPDWAENFTGPAIKKAKAMKAENKSSSGLQSSAGTRDMASWTEYYHATDLVDWGDYENALRLAEDRIRTHPNDASAHLVMGKAYYRSGKWDKAIDSLEKAEYFAPNWAESYTRPMIEQAKAKRAAKSSIPGLKLSL